MSDEMETPAQPRTSRFKEHTNTASSIKPPPDALWQDLAIEDMIEKFNEEARAPPTRKGVAKAITPPSFGAPTVAGHTATPATATPTTNEGVGTFERFSRAFASVFGSVLGKRKAGASDAEKEKEKEQRVLEERKRAADEAYAAMKMAREQGLLPTPKVFVRPTMTPRTHKCVAEHNAPPTPRTPSLYKSPSKKDMQKQQKLTKRVSDLEHKLASARKELHTVLLKDVPPVPPLPALLPPMPTPDTSQTTTTTTSTQIFSEREVSQDTQATTPSPSQQIPLPAPAKQSVGKIVKKRKATTTIDDETYKPIPTDSDGDFSMSASEPEQPRTIKRVKSQNGKKAKRQTSRLTKSRSRSDGRKEEPVVIIPDGKKVPMVPEIPKGVEGKKARIRDDGYGGLEHEMF
ncbi:hypothetical protein HBI71_013360 [Parastagonospora nodorum]|nr:hypothetical protein HBI71_013360 [Parastagonospora nodorum]